MNSSLKGCDLLTAIQRFRMAVLLGSLAAFGPLTIDMYLPSFPTIANDLSTNASLVQVSLTACLLGLGLGQMFLGPLSDIQGRRKPLLIGIALYVVASLICAVSSSIELFIAGRFIQGFAASAGIVISRAIVRDMFSGLELTKFFALLMLLNGLAPILAPVVGGVILEFTDWNGIFYVLSAVGGIMLLIVFSSLKETLPLEKRVPSTILSTFRTFIDLLKDRQFTGYALTQGFMTGAIFAYVSGTPFVYQTIYGVSPQTFSYLFGVNGLGLMLGVFLVGRFANKYSETRILQVGLTIAGIASVTLFFTTLFQGPLVLIAIPLFFFVSTIGLISTTSFSLAIETQGHRAGSASALLGLLPFLLGSITAPLTGIAGESTALPMSSVILISIALSWLAYLGLVRKGQQSIERGVSH
ncbi:DHA1 family bicyclomycin/chloramphenicol resistance-like MFS transporter [Aureibacillus halotolerans]|uniref:Bcr/CflA family efflux transporter n=2 Tax=Aureibacillus halotolerans TaxID=1508390 RepID=A0A4R6UDD6_9BACI|nr:DHA1 family bicyclomycin/chloramphenicol resistance-like MFS transporter [Aureibacillus halotolerans]